MLGINSSLKIRNAPVTVDFRGGIKHRVDVNPNDPENSVRLRVVGFKISAELPALNGGGVATITIEQNDVDVDPKSLLRVAQRFPPKFENIMVLPFTMSIDQRGNGEPSIWTTKDPAQLIGMITQFPPKGDLYQLARPVELVDLENPNNTGLRI
ncbi:hypothetical protein [Actinacidiphila oryziradicis]|nr:hypothetical protein [Actinacidiphila oryziradicis]